jgi:hypothetical protein
MEKKTDNTALAWFITSLGSLNSYGSTVLQTKQALDASGKMAALNCRTRTTQKKAH